MSKRIFLTLFSLVFLFFIACDQETPPKDSPPFLQEVEYAVGIKAEGLETKGIFCYKSDGSFTFIIQEENTPLNGYKVTVEEDELKTEYGGILWRSDEVKTTFSKVCKTLSNFENASLVAKEKTTYRDTDAIHFTYSLDGGMFHIWKKLDDQSTITIRHEADDLSFTLNFLSTP